MIDEQVKEKIQNIESKYPEDFILHKLVKKISAEEDHIIVNDEEFGEYAEYMGMKKLDDNNAIRFLGNIVMTRTHYDKHYINNENYEDYTCKGGFRNL